MDDITFLPDKASNLKDELDRIDSQIYDEVYGGYYNSRLRVQIGMWEKGEVIACQFTGGKMTNWHQLAQETGRRNVSLKQWYETYDKNKDRDIYIEQIAKPKAEIWTQKALTDKNTEVAHVSYNSGENEWYTPPEFIESARVVMGSIDLDPASSDIANDIVNATIYHTVETNGLNEKWEGNVWLNPPYAQPEISQFADKVVLERGNFNQIIVLVNNATDTQWLQSMMQISTAMCFVKTRVKFTDKYGDPGAPLQGQVILYVGDYIKEFYNEFKKYGICVKIMLSEVI